MDLRTAGGWTLLILGVAGIVLPIIPGVPLVAAGAAMLGNDHWVVRSSKDWLRSKGILR